VDDFDAAGPEGLAVLRETLEHTVLLLSPFAPHLCEELWTLLGHEPSILGVKWPKHDPKALTVDEVELVVQVDGKVRSRIKVPAGCPADEVRNRALIDPKVAEILAGRTPKDIIYIAGRLVNVVTDVKEKKKAESPKEAAAFDSSDYVSFGQERDPGEAPGNSGL
jgi:leucyl-tRNA synthetase